jgi:hypothetical protein
MRDDLERTLRMIVGQAEMDGAMFRGGPWRSPLGQIEVYREQYLLRLGDVLDEDLPGTRALLGDAYPATIRRYLAENVPNSWTLSRAADRLAGWLTSQGAPGAWVEMANLDWVVQRGFVAADAEIPGPAEVERALAAGHPWQLQPHVTLLEHAYNVHLLRSDAVMGDPVRPLAEGRVFLAIYRGPELRMNHIELEPAAFALLAALRKPAGLDVAVDAAIQAAGDDAERVASLLQPWFQRFMIRGLLQLAPEDLS